MSAALRRLVAEPMAALPQLRNGSGHIISDAGTGRARWFWKLATARGSSAAHPAEAAAPTELDALFQAAPRLAALGRWGAERAVASDRFLRRHACPAELQGKADEAPW